MKDAETVKIGGTNAPRKYFGAYLQHLRETYSERIAANGTSGVVLRAGPTAKALVECLNQHQYPISAATYSEIENGLALPRDGNKFVEALGVCLHLRGEEKEKLVKRLGYDFLYTRLGEKATLVINPQQFTDH